MKENTTRLRAVPIRMPVDLRQWYAQEAVDNERSLNGEIVSILKERRNRVMSKRKVNADV